jgi:hypothetical protein
MRGLKIRWKRKSIRTKCGTMSASMNYVEPCRLGYTFGLKAARTNFVGFVVEIFNSQSGAVSNSSCTNTSLSPDLNFFISTFPT